MSGLSDVVIAIISRFGRPARWTDSAADRDDDIDRRLESLERKERAMLRMMEKAGNPWGVGRDR